MDRQLHHADTVRPRRSWMFPHDCWNDPWIDERSVSKKQLKWLRKGQQMATRRFEAKEILFGTTIQQSVLIWPCESARALWSAPPVLSVHGRREGSLGLREDHACVSIGPLVLQKRYCPVRSFSFSPADCSSAESLQQSPCVVGKQVWAILMCITQE